MAKTFDKEDNNDNNYWDKLEDEPEEWYGRFLYFLRLGAERSIRQAYENYCIDRDGLEATEERKRKYPYALTTSTPAWFRARDQYHWRERATAYDSQQHARSLAMLDEERELCRKERRTAFHELMTAGVRALSQFELSESNLAQITQAINVGARGLRTEYGDDIQNKPIQLEALLAVLPDELRSPIVLALRATAGGTTDQTLDDSTDDLATTDQNE